MYLASIENLIKYLMAPGITISEVCKYLVLNTFNKLNASAAYAVTITKDGCLSPIGAFGLPDEIVNSWGSIPLSKNTPLSDAVKQNKLILLHKKDSLSRYPILKDHAPIPQDWGTFLVCPTLPYGSIAITLNDLPKMNRELEQFIKTVGYIIFLHFHSEKSAPRSQRESRFQGISKGSGVLTERQKLITKLIEKGYSNPQIAVEIGYSESLVRQETMAIYTALDISGRKELLAKSKERS